jgi:intracellular septation protein A
LISKLKSKPYPTFEKKLRKRKIIGIHILTFVILAIALFLSAEPLLNKFASGIHNVGMWLNLILYGTIGILILTIISCLIFLKKITPEH